jgi:hypothetical protein
MMALDLNLGWHGGLAGGTGAAALPAFSLQQLWAPLGWGVVLAVLVHGLTARVSKGRFHRGVSWGAAVAVLLWSLWPGAWSVSYWLGLAFQAPSGLAVVLACNALWRTWRKPAVPMTPTGAWAWWALALLGWVLLLDTFAWWPQSIYAWGFGPQALGWVVLVSLVPMVVGGWRAHPAVYALPLVLLLFVALRLPTGNVWDTVLDPWLWVWVQYRALRQLWRYLKLLRK